MVPNKDTAVLPVCPLIFSADNTYVPYLWCSLASLIDCRNPNRQYKIFILNTAISESNKIQLRELQTDGVSIEFIDVDHFMKKFWKETFYLPPQFTIETYYRIFLPLIFPDFAKVLYLDCDSIFLKDMSILYDIDLGDNYLAASHDYEIIRTVAAGDEELADYVHNVLQLENISDYFQAGCMVLNLEKMRKDNIVVKFIECLDKMESPKYADQCIMNCICQGKVKFFPANWDYTWNLVLSDNEWYPHLGAPFDQEYYNAKRNPYMVHFAGKDLKPENYPELWEAQLFWKYAAKSPYLGILIEKYTQLRQKKLKELQKINKKLKKYKILNAIFGKVCKKYAEKYNRTAIRMCKFLSQRS